VQNGCPAVRCWR